MCSEPSIEGMPDNIKEFWTQQGDIISICKQQKNPMKNLIFNKDNGIDLMRDHRLFSGADYQIFSTNSGVKLGIGRKLIDGNMLFEG